MAIDFPNSPSIGQTFTSGVRTWTWNGSVWNLTSYGVQGATGATGAVDFTTAQIISAKTDSYTLVTSDAGKLITVDASSAKNITVNSTLDLSAGQRIDILQLGAGQVTIVASGATVNGSPGLKLRARYSMATVLCTASDTYVVVGDVVA